MELRWEISADAAVEVARLQAALVDFMAQPMGAMTPEVCYLWKMQYEAQIKAVVMEDKLEWCYEQLRG
jgi:hypothetical protein